MKRGLSLIDQEDDAYYHNFKMAHVISESSVVLSFVVCAITGTFFGYYPAQ
jgi:hypothetical protein